MFREGKEGETICATCGDCRHIKDDEWHIEDYTAICPVKKELVGMVDIGCEKWQPKT
jgi:hypothetical protein